MPPPPTARLAFRCWQESDGALARVLWCDPEVMQHMGGALTPAEAEDRLRGEIERGSRTGLEYWPLTLREAGAFAGCAGLRPWADAPERAGLLEAGVHLMRSAWGQRLGEEAFAAVLAFGFEVLGLRTIVAGHGKTNRNSQALIGRMGFQHTHDGIWALRNLPVRWYALEADAWRGREALRGVEAGRVS